jgi:hypothetical protein
VIVVLGRPAAQTVDGVVQPAGLAGWIALAAAEAGAEVQVVGRIGDDPTGDAVVLRFARARVGHAALLREASHATSQIAASDDWGEDLAEIDRPVEAWEPGAGASLDAEDVALGLRYLTAFSVLVIADSLEPGALAAALEAAAFTGARTLAVVREDSQSVAADDVFVAPDGDVRTLAATVGRYAAALDAGGLPDDALRAATAEIGWAASAETGSPASEVAADEGAGEPTPG